ncbi:hypothetical protein FG93_03143 [Bosea sp. LC85]|nr:hypothetical protein FG93_03143 [Bosea sp. LC85]
MCEVDVSLVPVRRPVLVNLLRFACFRAAQARPRRALPALSQHSEAALGPAGLRARSYNLSPQVANHDRLLSRPRASQKADEGAACSVQLVFEPPDWRCIVEHTDLRSTSRSDRAAEPRDQRSREPIDRPQARHVWHDHGLIDRHNADVAAGARPLCAWVGIRRKSALQPRSSSRGDRGSSFRSSFGSAREDAGQRQADRKCVYPRWLFPLSWIFNCDCDSICCIKFAVNRLYIGQ